MDVLSSWMGRIPCRLSLLAVAGGALLATMTGSGAVGTAMLGSMLAPWTFCGLNCFVMGLLMVFPKICTWLPNLMTG
jgi:hypothetical protein